MKKNLYITAFYKLKTIDYFDEIIKRFTILAKHFPLYVFCSEEHREFLSSIPNLTVHVKELETFQIYSLFNTKTKQLPEIRWDVKDNKEFMGLMNTKIEFILEAKRKISAERYIWLDAGISKILQNPDETLSSVYSSLEEHIFPEMIIITGCKNWPPTNNIDFLLQKVYWRFCGGFFVVPNHMIEDFFKVSEFICYSLLEKTGRAIWEVNVWVLAERYLPILWKEGDHNETIFSIF